MLDSRTTLFSIPPHHLNEALWKIIHRPYWAADFVVDTYPDCITGSISWKRHATDSTGFFISIAISAIVPAHFPVYRQQSNHFSYLYYLVDDYPKIHDRFYYESIAHRAQTCISYSAFSNRCALFSSRTAGSNRWDVTHRAIAHRYFLMKLNSPFMTFTLTPFTSPPLIPSADNWPCRDFTTRFTSLRSLPCTYSFITLTSSFQTRSITFIVLFFFHNPTLFFCSIQESFSTESILNFSSWKMKHLTGMHDLIATEKLTDY